MARQMHLSNDNAPVPSIFISLDNFSSQAIQSIQQIYLRSDKRRGIVTEFLQAIPGETGSHTQLGSLSEGVIMPSDLAEQTDTLELRSIAFQNYVRNAQMIKTELEKIIYAMRTHERLLQAGWGQVYDVPLHIYILADASNPCAAGMVIPWLALLQQIAQDHPMVFAHVLCNVASFPTDSAISMSDNQIQVSTFLDELDQFLHFESKTRPQIQNLMGFPHIAPWMPIIFIFDKHKEGTYMVKDKAEMQTMIGNSLLALLQNGVSRQITRYHDENEIFESQSFYNSLGVSALVYDPQSLQNACAQKVVCEFLDEKILVNNADQQIAAREARGVLTQVGETREWFAQLASPMPPALGQVRVNPEDLEMAAILTGFDLSPLDFEHFEQTPWAKQLEDTWAVFCKKTLPVVIDAVQKNAEEFQNRTRGTLQYTIDRLPVQPDLYPSGIKNAHATLDLLREEFQKTRNSLIEIVDTLPEKQALLEAKYIEIIQQIEIILADAPPVPRLIRILPAFLRQWVLLLHYYRNYAHQIQKLRNLKQAITHLLWKRVGINIHEQALKQVVKALQNWIDLIDQGIADYQSFFEQFELARGMFKANWGEFPLGDEDNHWHKIFRIPVVNQPFAAWSFENWYPGLDEWVVDIFELPAYCDRWRDIEVDEITSHLLSRAQLAYQTLWELSLDDVLGHDTVAQAFEPPSNPLAATMQTTLPLLRPDFDTIGSARISYTSAYGLLATPEWEHCKLPDLQGTTIKWEPFYTHDPFIVICAQARHTAPLSSLTALMQPGNEKFEKLPPEIQQKYSIVSGANGDSIARVPANIDPVNLDKVFKTFRWKFKPKGGREALGQAIELGISQNRYTYYRNQPRLNGRWNHYAEKDMPEIHQLVISFQTLHAEQSWSTFNQAYNVMKFVQSCIPYSKDVDSTGHADWPRYPIETILDETGDCEDLAILCSAIIARLGFSVVLLHYPGHLAFGVAGADHLKGEYIVEPGTGRRYYYGEATAENWHLGQIPPKYRELSPEAILPVSILLQDDQT